MRRPALASAAALGAWSAHNVGIERIRAALVRIGWGLVAIVALAGVREAARTLAWIKAVERPERLSFRDAFEARLAVVRSPHTPMCCCSSFTFGLAVLYLMLAKPAASESIAVLAAAAACVVLSRVRAIAQRGSSTLAPSAR